MAPPMKADRDSVQDRRPSRTVISVVVDPDVEVTIPPLPMAVLPPTAEVWERFWRSKLARAIDLDIDLPGLNRWIVAYDEWLRAMAALRRRRVVSGSTGQPVISPVAGYIAQLEGQLGRADTAYGLTPRARATLGLVFTAGALTAARLNEMTHDRGNPTDAEDEALEAEWEAV